MIKINMVSFILVLTMANLVKLVNSHIHLDWDTTNPAFDPSIYEEALNPELCEQQLEFIRSDIFLRLGFLDAGARFPKGFFIGNTLDMGNYHQCLNINQEFEDSVIQGKYCLIRGPVNQNLNTLVRKQWSEIQLGGLKLNNETLTQMQHNDERISSLNIFNGNTDTRIPGTPFAGSVFRLAVCVPKACTTGEGMQGLLFDFTPLDLEFQDEFCRLPNDKPWVAADYVAITLFSLIGLITLVSTGYDLCQAKFLKKDPKEINKLGTMFSVYTNTRRLMNFTSGPDSLECVDGVRSLAMAWVIVGHTFTSVSAWSNPWDTFTFSSELSSLWITSGHLTVDTFFTLSGLLAVYTTAGKFTGLKLLKNIHLFYLNRLLRMFPLLAVGVLLEASIAHRISDGPMWQTVASQANRCRTMWWTTLLHIQNYVSPRNVCIGQSWYLAIDVQCHILSPLVLVWVLGNKRRTAWIALTVGLLASVTGATIYNFIKEFPSGMMTPSRGHEMMYYMIYYYMNTLTRASPFFVGMICGYILHILRGKRVKLSKVVVALLWLCTLVLSSTVVYATYPALQIEWDNQLGDTLINSFQRPAWAMAVSWMIIACVHGYGGGINWFLSLNVWKLPARVSYGMYILHWMIMTVISGTRIAPLYFTVPTVIYNFLSQYALSFILSFIVTMLVDSPCSTLFKMILGGGSRKPKQDKDKEEDLPKTDSRPNVINGISMVRDGYSHPSEPSETKGAINEGFEKDGKSE